MGAENRTSTQLSRVWTSGGGGGATVLYNNSGQTHFGKEREGVREGGRQGGRERVRGERRRDAGRHGGREGEKEGGTRRQGGWEKDRGWERDEGRTKGRNQGARERGKADHSFRSPIYDYSIAPVTKTATCTQLRAFVYGEATAKSVKLGADPPPCSSFVHLTEAKADSRISLCGAGDRRDFELYVSTGHRLQVFFENKSPVTSVFMIEFKGTRDDGRMQV